MRRLARKPEKVRIIMIEKDCIEEKSRESKSVQNLASH